MKQLANVRKAVAGRDDTTFTRWVKEPGRHKSGRPPALMPATATGPKFPSRVLPVEAMGQLLVSGHSNIKIGRDVRIGKLTGYWIFTLSLPERSTCPSSCVHWRDCYGNNMPFAKRVDHTDPDFLPTLDAEIGRLLAVRGRKGVLVRLHALGDFYSEGYVDFWREMLLKHPNLAIFGYTAWGANTPIGNAVGQLNWLFGGRAWMRFSDGGLPTWSTVALRQGEECPPGAFLCPEQTGQFDGCGKCGACWGTAKNVAFTDH